MPGNPRSKRCKVGKKERKKKKGSDVILCGEELTGLPNLPSDRRIASKSQPFRDGRSSRVFAKKWRTRSHLHKSVSIYERSRRTLARNRITLARVNKVHTFVRAFSSLSFISFFFLAFARPFYHPIFSSTTIDRNILHSLRFLDRPVLRSRSRSSFGSISPSCLSYQDRKLRRQHRTTPTNYFLRQLIEKYQHSRSSSRDFLSLIFGLILPSILPRNISRRHGFNLKAFVRE